MSTLHFNSEGSVSLKHIPAEKTLKISAIADIDLTEDQIKALNNDKASEGNKFVSSDDIAGIIIASSRTPPAGYPRLITSDEVITIPKSGKYIIKAVGGGGSGSWATTENNLKRVGVEGHPTIIEINGITYTAKGGKPGYYRGPYIASPNYSGDGGGIEGSTEGGDSAAGQNGAFPGGKGDIKAGTGGGGSPFPVNPYNIKAENGVSGTGVGGHGGQGYGAGGGGGSINSYFGKGANSGFLITKKLYLEKYDRIKINIGAGGEKVSYTNASNVSYFASGGAGAPGAVQIEWDSNQD